MGGYFFSNSGIWQLAGCLFLCNKGGDTFDSEDIEEWEDYQIKGADDIFVCIPKPIYKCLIKYLSKR